MAAKPTPAFPRILYVACREDGEDSYFLATNRLADHAEVEPKPVAFYKLIETGVVRDMRSCKYKADR